MWKPTSEENSYPSSANISRATTPSTKSSAAIPLSYSCMSNMKAVINNHNTQIIAPKPTRPSTDVQGCNCKIKNQCPLLGQCLTPCIVYQAKVTTTDSKKDTETTRNHSEKKSTLTKRSFRSTFGAWKDKKRFYHQLVNYQKNIGIP